MTSVLSRDRASKIGLWSYNHSSLCHQGREWSPWDFINFLTLVQYTDLCSILFLFANIQVQCTLKLQYISYLLVLLYLVLLYLYSISYTVYLYAISYTHSLRPNMGHIVLWIKTAYGPKMGNYFRLVLSILMSKMTIFVHFQFDRFI